MTELLFSREEALEAIRMANINGLDWLYENYPKPNGQKRKSTTGFLIYEGAPYPMKPLGRLANEIAGRPMIYNPTTNVFRKYFEDLGFRLIDSPADEAESAAERQRRLAEVWQRPDQVKFRRAVFELFGARCLVTGCESLVALEVAHVVPVSEGGCDEAWNGIPLRADLHRLFDAGKITLDATTWTLRIAKVESMDYGQYHEMDLGPVISKIEDTKKLSEALRKRMNLTAQNLTAQQ